MKRDVWKSCQDKFLTRATRIIILQSTTTKAMIEMHQSEHSEYPPTTFTCVGDFHSTV